MDTESARAPEERLNLVMGAPMEPRSEHKTSWSSGGALGVNACVVCMYVSTGLLAPGNNLDLGSASVVRLRGGSGGARVTSIVGQSSQVDHMRIRRRRFFWVIGGISGDNFA